MQLPSYKSLISNPVTRNIWLESFSRELGRLSNGYKHIEGTNTISFIPFHDIPPDRRRDITYGNPVVAYKPRKADTHRTRLTDGGDRIKYQGPLYTPAVDLTVFKIFANNVISTPNARFSTADIANFYLESPFTQPEYISLPISLVPEQFIQLYNLSPLVTNGKLYLKVTKTMYGFPQSGSIAHVQLADILHKAGFQDHDHTPGLWTHQTKPISFILLCDDFGIKYVIYKIIMILLQFSVNIILLSLQTSLGNHFLGYPSIGIIIST